MPGQYNCKKPNIYQITKNIGHCLVISNVAFEHPEGSQKDTSALIHAYSAIGFEEDQSPCGECINQDNQVRICETCQLKNKIHVYEDCTNEKMRSIRDDILGNEDMHRDKSMIVINILTHGTEDGFLMSGVNGYGWHIPDIIRVLCSNRALMTKPKLFFICACRGIPVDGEPPTLRWKLAVPELNKPFIYLGHNEIDMFLGFSTCPGKVTLISEEGTEFFQALAYHLEHDHKHLPLKQIFTKITDTVSRRSEHVNQELSTLRSMVFFTETPSVNGNLPITVSGNYSMKNVFSKFSKLLYMMILRLNILRACVNPAFIIPLFLAWVIVTAYCMCVVMRTLAFVLPNQLTHELSIWSRITSCIANTNRSCIYQPSLYDNETKLFNGTDSPSGKPIHDEPFKVCWWLAVVMAFAGSLSSAVYWPIQYYGWKNALQMLTINARYHVILLLFALSMFVNAGFTIGIALAWYIVHHHMLRFVMVLSLVTLLGLVVQVAEEQATGYMQGRFVRYFMNTNHSKFYEQQRPQWT